MELLRSDFYYMNMLYSGQKQKALGPFKHKDLAILPNETQLMHEFKHWSTEHLYHCVGSAFASVSLCWQCVCMVSALAKKDWKWHRPWVIPSRTGSLKDQLLLCSSNAALAGFCFYLHAICQII